MRNISSCNNAQDWLDGFRNFEQRGVPKDAGTDSAAGFDLERMHRLLDCLGNPHRSWPAVHIAGTKGKGSVACMLSGILKASGYRVGTYTSPHVLSIRERILSDGTPISVEHFESLVSRHSNVIDNLQEDLGGTLTYFEVLTGLAFRYFAERHVDVAVVEAGLGGTRDATNVFSEDPQSLLASVITPIGLEHVDALGGSLESIVAAKAGIMKRGRPVVLAPQPEPLVEKLLLQHATTLHCPVIQAQDCVHFCQSPQILLSEEATKEFDDGIDGARTTALQQKSTVRFMQPWISSALHADSPEMEVCMRLVGVHQLDNAATAITAAACLAVPPPAPSNIPDSNAHRPTVLSENGDVSDTYSNHSLLKFNISSDAVVDGLHRATLPGRFQAFSKASDRRSWIVLDGAHTKESARRLVETVQTVFDTTNGSIALVVSMANDKNHVEVLSELRKLRPCVAVFTESPVAERRYRSAPPGALVAAWQLSQSRVDVEDGRESMSENGTRPRRGRFRCRELIQASLPAAMSKAEAELAAKSSRGDRVTVVTGSLHLVGAALSQIHEKELKTNDRII